LLLPVSSGLELRVVFGLNSFPVTKRLTETRMSLTCHYLFRPAFSLLAGLAVLVLSSCSSFEGTYGPGAGQFDTVIIDAGHGGHDSGARALSGRREKELALDTSRRVAKILRGQGLRVIETRTGDYFVPLGRRTSISNRTGRAVFVSIHYNWARRRGARGFETFYHSYRSKRLAANILKEMRKAYPSANRGVKKARFYVLRNNKRPSVLLELGFLSNSQDNRYVQSWYYRKRLAERIARGILAEKAGRRP